MKIEAGKFYKCSNGTKARIYAVDCGDPLSIHGAIFVNDFWGGFEWKSDGKRNAVNRYDLVSEWIDPPQKKKYFAYFDSKVNQIAFSTYDDITELPRLPQFDIEV